MNIIVTDISGLSVFVFPIVPVETPINSNGSNETHNGLDGRFRIIDNQELKNVSWSSFFPVNKNYSFVKKGSLANGYLYVTFIELMKRYKLPVRLIMTTNNKIPFLNLLMTIDSFSTKIDKVGDIYYSISLTEFPETFSEFISREKAILKYIKNLDIKSKAKEKLQSYGLLQ